MRNRTKINKKQILSNDFFFASRRRHTRLQGDWSSDVCSSDLYPRLWGERLEFVGGHAWAVPARERTAKQKDAIARFFKFMAAHNFDWARTGHIPAFKAVLDDPRFKALPHRADIALLGEIGRPLPSHVRRQSAIEGLVGEEMAAAVTGQKPVERALRDAERRVNELLGEVD